MSVNYYAENKCKCCDNVKRIHLGASSHGWTFTFQGDREANVIDFDSWLNRINALNAKGYEIVNEYNDKIGLDDLCNMIKDKRNAPQNQVAYWRLNDLDYYNEKH